MIRNVPFRQNIQKSEFPACPRPGSTLSTPSGLSASGYVTICVTPRRLPTLPMSLLWDIHELVDTATLYHYLEVTGQKCNYKIT